jgi:hypothetical protein
MNHARPVRVAFSVGFDVQCTDCGTSYKDIWFPVMCEFCGKPLCEFASKPSVVNICISCKQQSDASRRKITQGLMSFLTKDCASVVISYFCLHSVMSATPLWGFLTRFEPRWSGTLAPRRRLCTCCGRECHCTGRNQCHCASQSRCDVARLCVELVQVKYDPSLYPEKPLTDPPRTEFSAPNSRKPPRVLVRH